MNAKFLLTSLAVVGGLAMATPGFAQDRNYPNGERPGTYGMDVAPGGGVYTRQDAANESPDRMSHPTPGERRAPSNMAQGSLSDVDAAEDAQTAKLNQQQLDGGMTANLPDNQ